MKIMNLDTQKLRNKKVGVLSADGFEYVELSIPKKALRLAGATVEIISLHGGRIRGMNLTEPSHTVRVDRTIEQADPSDYDALLIPGGFIGPDLLRQSSHARAFVSAVDAAHKPIATLCHGPWLLVSAERVKGRTLASWPGIRDDIVHAGGIWRDEPVVRDGNWVSSRGPQDLLTFVPAMIDLFARGNAAGDMSEPLTTTAAQAEVSSPRPEQPPAVAVAGARLLPGPTVRTLGAATAVTALGALILRRAG